MVDGYVSDVKKKKRESERQRPACVEEGGHTRPKTQGYRSTYRSWCNGQLRTLAKARFRRLHFVFIQKREDKNEITQSTLGRREFVVWSVSLNGPRSAAREEKEPQRGKKQRRFVNIIAVSYTARRVFTLNVEALRFFCSL